MIVTTPIAGPDDDDAFLRAVAELAWREEIQPVTLPTVLTRPSTEGAVGSLDYSEPEDPKSPAWPRWRITGSAHAVIMARKLFGTDHATTESSNGTISFPATLGSFDELLLLLHRFPLRLTDQAQAIFDRMYRQLVAERHIAASVPAETAAGKYFRGRLLPFQTEGVAFLCAVRKGLLADDMGLGKTVQAFGFLDRVASWPAVIVVQSHVQRHWEKKITEFMRVKDLSDDLGEGLRVVSLNGGKRFDSTPRADVYIVHYLVLHAWFEFLIERGVRTVIFDECQELRHPNTRKHEACTALAKAADNVAGLSGTPIYNHGIEMHAVINTLCRGALGTRAAFERDWCTCVAGKVVVADPEVLGEYLRDRRLMLRRRKEDVHLELPAKRRVIEPIAADQGIFADLVVNAAKLAREAADIENPFDRARMEAEAIRETRRATALAKLPAVIGFLRGLMEAGEPTLVFLHHHAVTDGILEALEEFKPVCITGRQDKDQKDAAVITFAAGETNLCLISLRAATGIDGLQKRARVVVFAELDWSPAIHRQAEDRAHRMGQRDSVLAYYLVTDLGTDPFVMMTLNLKASQFTGLMQDRSETDDDKRDAKEVAKQHMAGVLAMLRGKT